MSELKGIHRECESVRWRLLLTVSSVALLTAVTLTTLSQAAAADDIDRPAVWIELGGQAERWSAGQEAYLPTALIPLPSFVTVSPLSIQRPPRYSQGFEGKISFTPQNSRFVFSASVRYGKSNGGKNVHEQTYTKLPNPYYETLHAIDPSVQKSFVPNKFKFIDTTAQTRESHAIVDFQAGKEVGLGLFGNHSSSVLSAGVRFAQLASSSSVDIYADPDLYYPSHSLKYPEHRHMVSAHKANKGSFFGIGPSVSWTGSTPIAGGPDTALLGFDWGANAAVLFGRQKTSGHQSAVASYFYHPNVKYTPGRPPLTQTSSGGSHNRSRSIVIPNIGGFAGLSLRSGSFRFALGYRADYFFGAMDSGLDVRKSADVGFHGPYATIGIGLGG